MNYWYRRWRRSVAGRVLGRLQVVWFALIVLTMPSWQHMQNNAAQPDPVSEASFFNQGLIDTGCFLCHDTQQIMFAPLEQTQTALTPPPEPPNLGDFVQNRTAAVQLGKALFWDTQVGSDGKQACASCHFQAGADNRVKNQVNPGHDGWFQVAKPNATLAASNFPFHQLANPNDANSSVLRDSDDIASSQGVFKRTFVKITGASSRDQCVPVADAVFNVKGINVRQVQRRNSPTVINAVYNFRNFWDGTASATFNGASPWGQRDPNARVWKLVNNQVQPTAVVIPFSSLASQAVAPVLSGMEGACEGRTFALIGRKLLATGVMPLKYQKVARDDSVLGARAASTKGLTISYSDLVKQAFRPEYWNAPASAAITVNGEQFTQMQANFALFFGLAVQAYESTLISNQTPYDRFVAGNTTALTAQQQQGLQVFQNEGKCVNCHSGPEFTNASVRNVASERLERMIMGDGGCAIYDNGFYNIGVRPTNEDLGVGGTDPFGNPLSDTRMAQQGTFSDPNLAPPLGSMPECDTRAAVDGAFKTPTLRNVELTGPYFHNGGQATLRQVVDFYNRGGDFAVANRTDLDPDIQALGLTDDQKNALVAFMLALTDERVRRDQAPFDHPELCILNGQVGDATSVVLRDTGEAKDATTCIPAVGAKGTTPRQPFLNLSPFQP